NRPARAKSGSKATPGRRHDAAIRAAERVVQTFLNSRQQRYGNSGAAESNTAVMARARRAPLIVVSHKGKSLDRVDPGQLLFLYRANTENVAW
ncbi:hypothetical protein, partial [Ralstonia mannitolilytica]|uniref:hypothetical protein n=1 Tax=Ralstonia mannitolilytica TaxID=105219 RepID=UPI0029307884